MSVTNDVMNYLRDRGHRVVDRRGQSMGGNRHNRSLSKLTRGGFHWDGVKGGTIEGHERHWRENNKWSNGGYSAFIHDDGTFYMNYDLEKITNGVGQHNTPTLHICYGGTYGNPITDKQKQVVKDFWHFIVKDRRINIHRFDDIWGHNEFDGHSNNACPGLDMDVFRSYLKGHAEVRPTSNPEPKPVQSVDVIRDARLVKYENSTFTVTAPDGIKVRNEPSTSAAHMETLKRGQTIAYHAVYEGNGYRWLSYTNNRGKPAYVPYRPSHDVSNQWGTFGSPKPHAEPKTIPSVAGAAFIKQETAKFTVNNGIGIKVRNAPSTKAAHTGTLQHGQTIRYDRIYEGNGYRWLSYIASSGNRLYVPYQPIHKKDNQWGRFH